MSSSKPGNEAHAVLARYLRSGVKSTHEAVQHLTRRGVPSAEARRAARAFRARGVLDDRACARLWAGHWTRQGYAASAIRLKLAAKGLSRQVIDEATRSSPQLADDEARARDVAARAFRTRSQRATPARLARALASRGFDADLIDRLLRESFGQRSDAES